MTAQGVMDICGVQAANFTSLANSDAWALVDENPNIANADYPALPSVMGLGMIPMVDQDSLRAVVLHNYGAVSPDLYELTAETPDPPVTETSSVMPPVSNLVLDPDERAMISNTQDWPWRAIVALVADIPGVGETNVCSGVMVGPRHVLTAAHCLYETFNNLEARLVGVAPGMDGENNYPNGLLAIEDLIVPEGYRVAPDYGNGIPYDFGLVVLQDYNPCLGWFGMDPADNTLFVDNAQYPRADRPCPPDPMTTECGGFMYHQSCEIDNGDVWISDTCSVQQSASGSAMYNPNTLQSVGVVSGENFLDNVNYGVRLNEMYFREICYWISLFPTEGEQHECYF